MKISHRGNVEGRQPEHENKIDYIKAARKRGLQVEIDVWYADGAFFLGHDRPEIPLLETSFDKWDYSYLWLHCKNAEAYTRLLQGSPFHFNSKVNVFYHEGKEPSVLTSEGYLWSIHKDHYSHNAVAVLPEIFDFGTDLDKRYLAVCSDDLRRYS